MKCPKCKSAKVRRIRENSKEVRHRCPKCGTRVMVPPRIKKIDE